MLKLKYPELNTRQLIKYIVIILLVISSADQASSQQQRFPMPEFESGYQQPDVTTPEPRSAGLEYFDVLVLLLALSLGSWLVIKKRSRRWILSLAIFSLLYFGFYRNGCICAIGAVQNMSLSMSDPGYAVSYTIIAFFMLPLLFSLAMGRIFCGSVCPLGVIQDIFIIKPINVPVWVQKSLGLFPFVYLGLAILYASTGTDFIICRYDPFVGIFRMGGEFHLMVMGAAFLLTGMFVARPYCRFVCPYGALLRITSLFSKQHLTITPSKCIQCKLCSGSCPFGAIERPTTEKALVNIGGNTRKFMLYAAIIPVLMVAGGFALSSAHTFMAKANPDVYLAHLLIEYPEVTQDPDNLDVQTFLGSGRTMDSLVEDAGQVQEDFKTGGWILGAFLGLVIGIMIISPMIIRRRTDYQPNRGDCYSCGRCLKYCPVQK